LIDKEETDRQKVKLAAKAMGETPIGRAPGEQPSQRGIAVYPLGRTGGSGSRGFGQLGSQVKGDRSVKRRVSGIAISALALALMAAGTVRAAELKYTFKSVATLDSTVAGEPIHGDFEVGSVNASGAVGFVTELDNGEGALYIGPDGKAELLKKTGNDAPTGGVFTGYTSNKVGVTDAGNILMTVGVDTGDGEVITPLFFDRAANKWTVVATRGMPAPDGGTFEDRDGGNSFASVNNANEVAFTEGVTQSAAGPEGAGIFLWSKGKTTTVVRPGMKITRGTFVDAWRPQISDSGVVTFEGKLEGDADFGAYAAKGGVITEIASEQTVAPGGTAKFTTLKGVTANSNGDVAMLGATDAGWGAYLYTAKDQKLVKVAAPGDAMPGGGTVDSVQNSYRNSIRINDSGDVLFEVALADGSMGVYLYRNGELSVVARTGQDLGGGIGKAQDGTGNGLGFANNGEVLFTIKGDGDKVHLVVGTPPAPTAGQ
jgi:hypothetical protein